MSRTKRRNPLLTEEDWWAVWSGLIIIVVAALAGGSSLAGWAAPERVPKLGGWTSGVTDVFYQVEKKRVRLQEDTTLAALADAINGSGAAATADIRPADGGVALHVVSTRSGQEETITVATLLAGGAESLRFEEVDPDPWGKGARAYHSHPLPSAEAVVGQGTVTVTAERSKVIIVPLIFTLIGLVGLTTLAVWAMGQRPGPFAGGATIVFLMSVLSFWIARNHVNHSYGLSYAAWALAFGLLVSNTIGTPQWLKAGVRTEFYIKTGLVLLGAEVLFSKILAIGVPGLMVAWLVTPTVIIFMWLFGNRVLKMSSKPLIMIVAAATSVCGVSAAIAVAAAARAKKEELTLAVGMTLIFTVLMMIFMPMFIHAVGIGPVLGGAWMGGTIDSTGAVVAAGAFLGPAAETVAAVVKMIQNVLIGLVGFAVALFWITSVERQPNAPRPSLGQVWVRFPKFVVGFVGASVLFSFVLVPLFGALFDGSGVALVESKVIKPFTNPLRGWLFCMAFVSIGLESNFKELVAQMEGGKPMALYVVGQSFNLALTLAVAWLAFSVLFPNAV